LRAAISAARAAAFRCGVGAGAFRAAARGAAAFTACGFRAGAALRAVALAEAGAFRACGLRAAVFFAGLRTGLRWVFFVAFFAAFRAGFLTGFRVAFRAGRAARLERDWALFGVFGRLADFFAAFLLPRPPRADRVFAM
jgi:hypothetical protein